MWGEIRSYMIFFSTGGAGLHLDKNAQTCSGLQIAWVSQENWAVFCSDKGRSVCSCLWKSVVPITVVKLANRVLSLDVVLQHEQMFRLRK